MSDAKQVSRRSFFHFSLAGIIAIPLLLKSENSFAQAKCPTVPPKGKSVAIPNQGMAKTLQYVENATSSKNAKYKSGADCGNCKFYNNKKEDNAFAPCTMMGMKYVAKCGWCISYKAT